MPGRTSDLDDRLINTLERVYPGWHVWISDERFWYATWRGAPEWPEWASDPLRRPGTIWADNPTALSYELAAEEASRTRRWIAATAYSPAGAMTRETLNGCTHHTAEVPRETKRPNGTASSGTPALPQRPPANPRRTSRPARGS
jgi:hypothetical protein